MITAFLKLVPDIIKIPASMLVGAGVAFFPIKWYGASQERHEQELAQIARSLEVVRDRNKTNAEVLTAEPVDLCRFMGLSEQNYIECVRRMGANDPGITDLGDDHQNGQAVCQPGREP